MAISASMGLRTVTICFLLTCLQAGGHGTDCRISKPESQLSRLKKHLSCGYDSNAAPQVAQNSSAFVYLSLALRRFTLMEDHNTIGVFYGASMVWKDARLKWEPSDYGNIKQFYTSSSLIWTPQIRWITMDTDKYSLLREKAPCLLYWRGNVVCLSWSSFYTTCRTDLTHWPYDTHVCEAQVAPWRLQPKELELHIRKRTMFQFYKPNREWAVLNAVMERRSEVFENSSVDYAALTLTLARQSALHEASVVIPAIVLVVLTLASSWIEPECSTRLSLLCSLVVCHMLFLQHLGLSLINGISCPLIVLFYGDSMWVCGLSLVVTLIVRWMTCSPAIPPSWVSDIAVKVQESRPGQLLKFLFVQHPRQVADTEVAETPQAGPNWRLVGMMLDRISFLAFSVIYFVLLIVYYLYYL